MAAAAAIDGDDAGPPPSARTAIGFAETMGDGCIAGGDASADAAHWHAERVHVSSVADTAS